MEPGVTRIPQSTARNSAADQPSCAGCVSHRYSPASEWSTDHPAAVNAARSASRRASYRRRCAKACASSESAAAIAACTGVGTIIPACLRMASSDATSEGSPVTNPARYPARFDRLDSEWTDSTPSNDPPHTDGCSTETGAASQPSVM
jgi:hypothetical protein